MSVATTITYAIKIGTQVRVGFKLAFSGSYPSGGDTINFATATQDPSFVGNVAAVEALGAPISIDAWSQSGNIAIAYYPIVGTSPATGNKVKLVVTSSMGTEATAGTYASISSTIATDNVVGEATFNAL
jgi:hypothetical protein